MRQSRKSYGDNQHGDSGPSSGRRSARNGQSEAAWPIRSGSGMDGTEEQLRGVGEEELKAQLGCKCRNSRCLKLYCVCFAARKFCDGCACVDCGNTEENVNEVHKRRHKVNVKNPHAFQDKKNPIVAKGCNCLKSRCLKGYCECFAAGRGCMPICCCKDCENVYGERPGIDEAMLSRGKAGFLTRPMRTHAAFSEEHMHDDAPTARHGRLSKFDHPSQLGSGSEDDSGEPGSEDSSERPHPSLLNLVKAAEEIERMKAGEVAPGSPSPGDTRAASQPQHSQRGAEAAAERDSSPSAGAAVPIAKQGAAASPASRGSTPAGRLAAAAELRAASCELRAMASPAQTPSPQAATPGPADRKAGAGPDEAAHAEEHAVQDMHRLLLQQLKTTKLALPSGLNLTALDRILEERGPGSLGWPDLHRDTTAPPRSPPVPPAPSKAAKREKPVAVLASKAVPLEAARPQAPQPVRITVCRDGGGSAAVPLTVSPEVRGPPPAALSHRRAAPPRNHEAHATGAVSGASNCSGGGMERGSRRNQKGDTAEADDNAGAGRAGGGAAGAAAAHDAPSGADDCPLARREWGVSARGAGVCQGDAHAAAPMAAPPLAGATNGALAEGEAAAGGRVLAWLVSSSPHIPASGAAYASVPVQIAADPAAAGNDQTTLLIPSQALPPEATDTCGVQLRFHRVEMRQADLHAICCPGHPRTVHAPPAPGPCNRRSQPQAEAPEPSGGGSAEVEASGDSGCGAGGGADAGAGAHAAGAEAGSAGAPEACGAASAGASDKPRFRSARLRKRAEKEGPRLTQVAFDDVLQAGKRRREATEAGGAEAAGPEAAASEHSDFMSGLLGRRVCVPKRARSAITASQRAGQAGAADSGAHAAPSVGAHRSLRREERRGRGAGHAAAALSEPVSAPRPKQPSPRGGARPSASPRGDPGGHRNSLFMAGENNEEEEYAVMGLLRLCEAS